jgi:hypothetical protein
MDASEYIKELKQKVVRLNQEIAREEEATHSHKDNSFPTVHTDTHLYITAPTILGVYCTCIMVAS